MTRALMICCLLTGCGATLPKPVTLTQRALPGSDGQTHLVPASGATKLTVLVFFSAGCDCQTAHDARLRALAERYGSRGVAFFAVDSEHDASLEHDVSEARLRGYPFAILLDAHGALATTLGAEYATHTIVVDARGQVRYRGAIDSDLAHVRDDATPYLRDALDDLLAGRRPRRNHAEALGCSLQLE